MILEVENLHAFYGQSHILHGVDLHVGDGEIVSLLGRNGVGRSTACKAIMGLVPAQGTIRFRNQDISGLRPDQVAHCGIGCVPEEDSKAESRARPKAHRQIRPLEIPRRLSPVFPI